MVIEYIQTTKSKIQVIKNDINTYVDLSSLSIVKPCAYMFTTFIILNFFIKYVMILHGYK